MGNEWKLGAGNTKGDIDEMAGTRFAKKFGYVGKRVTSLKVRRQSRRRSAMERACEQRYDSCRLERKSDETVLFTSVTSKSASGREKITF